MRSMWINDVNLRNAETHAVVLGTGIQRQLKPGGPKGIVGSNPTDGTDNV